MVRLLRGLTSLLVLLLATCAMGADVPPPVGGDASTGLNLKTQLEKGLKARRPVEFQYIAQIVTLVENGNLPRDLVDSTFVWARKKRTRALQQFQFALKTRADALGYATPDLSNQLAPVTP